ncbi:MAG: hypothetical protein JRF64_11590 [Deltaproteobacteria bacterium]|nr:hypothetical protein [Deltaproteobacteria bacterium]
MDECANNQYATARCRPEAKADNRVVAEGESGDHGFTRGAPYGKIFSCESLSKGCLNDEVLTSALCPRGAELWHLSSRRWVD